ncbi:MAG: fibronectin type III domain-containing protein [Candidatus Omnitrophota bacterium]
MRNKIFKYAVIFGISWATLAAAPSYAELERVSATSQVNGYPEWYQDKTGIAFEFGTPLNQAELDGGWCLILPADVPSGTAPETFPTNFAEEHFYWAADANIDFNLPNGDTSRARLVLGLEGAFGTGPVTAGDQVVFGRVRVDIKDLPFSGTYTIYTPYGEWNFPDQLAGDRLFVTEDIGLASAPGTFDGAVLSHIGPFLLPANTPGGAELPAIAGPVQGKLYIADPARIGPVTGSPLAPFVSAVDSVTRDHNIFRVEGPNGFVIETTDFALAGRLFTGAIPGKVTIDRANYTHNVTGLKTDVYATGFPTTLGRLPGDPLPAAEMPILSFYNAPPDVDQTTGALLAPAGQSAIPMANQGTSFWGQSQPGILPLGITVKHENARDASGQIVPVFFAVSLTDAINITEAVFDPANNGSLSVRAQSSDEITPPTLSLLGFGDLVNGQIIVSPLAATPSKVNILSSVGGLNDLQVTTLFAPAATTVPDAPTIGSVAAGDSQVTVNFNAPASDGGSVITSYTVTSSPAGITATGTNSNPIIVTGLSNGIAYTFTVTATNAIGTGPSSAPSESVVPTIPIIVDNTDGAASVKIIGTWSTSTITPGFQGTNYLHDNNTGKGTKSVTFTPNILSAGQYQVAIRYTSETNRATAVPVDIMSVTGTTTVNVNQRTNGSTWFVLGTYTFATGTSGSVRINTTGTTDGFVIADAVQFIQVSTIAPVIVDNTDGPASVAIIGDWITSTNVPGYLGINYLHDNNIGKGSKSVTFAPNLPVSGQYQVAIRYTADPNRATAVPVDITSTVGTSTININQRINNNLWVSLGTYTFNAGTGGSVQILTTGTTDGFVAADAVSFVQVGP